VTRRQPPKCAAPIARGCRRDAALARWRGRRPLIEQRSPRELRMTTDKEPAMAYSVPPLPYAYDALEPHIDKATMEFHHDKHHQAYVDKANAALEGTPLAESSIEDVLKNLTQVPDDKRGAVKNNGGGHYNHTLFWDSMSPDGGGEPSGAMADAIASTFGSFADFQAKLKETGVNQFGSGWSWLVHDGSGLAILGTPNQDSPISDGKTPLLGVDVWEHAYYLKYQNRRPDYIDAWWNVVDWGAVGERFDAAG
jgi:Fe-Mn family superoxide dismutase